MNWACHIRRILRVNKGTVALKYIEILIKFLQKTTCIIKTSKHFFGSIFFSYKTTISYVI